MPLTQAHPPGKLLVFVYGTLRRGLPHHGLLASARYLGPARTKSPYALYVADFPRVVPNEAVSLIHGELYLVDNYTLALLDDLEDHPFVYERRQVSVIMDDGSETAAWIYFHPRQEGFLIPHGDLVAWLRDRHEDELR